jgi:stage II sporulation protein D
MPTIRATFLSLCLAAAGAAVAAAPAHAASSFVIRGAGFGHGVGMSQYGAMGYARHGASYDQILEHYYTGTQVTQLHAAATVRVLLQTTSAVSFTGANKAGGRKVSPGKRYTVRLKRGVLRLYSPKRHALKVKSGAVPMRITGKQPIVVGGRALNGRSGGAYRGALELRPSSGGGVNVINAVGIDDYVQGVVPVESPASWPGEALKAQAVAARTYALTTSKGGDGFDQYPDTRSQVYGGIGVEQATTNAATQATAGEVVTYGGAPVVTYFFSTSGGRTEDVENSALGTVPKPWLKSVDDPYDDVSPRHRWAPVAMSLGKADKQLGSLVKGKFRGIDVVQRGVSPRIMWADVVGSKGTTRVSGATLRARLGLYDTWAYFTTISTDADTEPAEPGAPGAATPPADADGGAATTPGSTAPDVTAPPTGGVTAAAAAFPARRTRISGRVVGSGRIVLQHRDATGAWNDVRRLHRRSGGTYRAHVTAAGAYRVRVGSAPGPVVRAG